MSCFRGAAVRHALALSALATAAPRLALACPACLGTDQRNVAFLKIGSLFVLVPFAVVALVLYVLRQAPERAQGGPPRALSRAPRPTPR